ncbi:Tetratricopeptide repeat protein 5 [Desmophyllum pertusum]|uniref:Tetratricopeptide repeat protein 5 n=1 Tax=Desmophyllum pertusum TaxID=174260 RepID=A0A9W9Z221_9CNID|nr:Tetratricopeptide repeat protein 5 [Desmophyllum pertusum]
MDVPVAIEQGFAVGDSVAIPEPFCQETNFTENDKTFNFSSIRVDNPVVLVVNKKKLVQVDWLLQLSWSLRRASESISDSFGQATSHKYSPVCWSNGN